MNRIALITGATSGIGEATARKMAENNFNLIITGRRIERLQKLSSLLENNHNIKCRQLHFDIQNRNAVENAIKSLPDKWKEIDVLVNNAGLAAGLAPIHEANIEDWEQMIDTNIKGLLYITRLISPLMVKQKKGHIINIGSIAGKEVYANGNVYCATKHALDALNKAMRIDLLPYNIKVTAINPGMVETEFSIVRFKGDTEKSQDVYTGLTPLYAEDIAEAVIFAATRPAHVNINDMLIMATAQANATYINRKK